MTKKDKFTLEELRKLKGLSRKKAGEALGVSEDTIYNYEKYLTYPDVLIIERIKKVYGVTYDDIIFLPSNYVLNVKARNNS